MTTSPTGVLLAAGAGSRWGGPKALARDEHGSWLPRAVHRLLDGGCERVVVVLGASAAHARGLIPPESRVRAVIATDWATGMSASLRVGLVEADRLGASSALISLVDLPDLPESAVRRIAGVRGTTALRQAAFGGRPGHPVLVGHDHFSPLIDTLDGDEGARGYLIEHRATLVECGDLWHGGDVDHR